MTEPRMTTSDALSLFEEREAKHGAIIADLRKRADDTERLIASGYFEAIRSALRRLPLLEAVAETARCVMANAAAGADGGCALDEMGEALAALDAADKEKP